MNNKQNSDLFDNVYNKLKEFSFLTGSRAFGTERPDSDFDMVYSVTFSEEIAKIIDEFEKEQSGYFAGYCIKIGEEVINLIPVHPHEFLPWYLATKAIKETLRISGLQEEPIKKYSVFMAIVSAFKGTVSQLRTVSEYQKQIKEILEVENESV